MLQAPAPELKRQPATYEVRKQPTLLPLAPASGYGINPESIRVETIAEGQNMLHVLQKLKFDHREINTLTTSHVIPVRTFFAAGDHYVVMKFKKGTRTEVRFYLPHADEALVFVKEGSTSDIQRIPVNYTRKLKTVSGDVQTYLAHDIKKSVNSSEVFFRLQDAFIFDFDLAKKMTRGSQYSFTVEEKYDHGQFIDYGDVTDVKITVSGVEHHRSLKVGETGKFFVDPSGNYESRLFFAPVNYLRVSSVFTLRRFHPVKHKYQPHLGVDFVDAEGTAIMAARAGEVSEVGFRKANGNFIILKHDGGYQTFYNHLAGVSPNVQIGTKVTAGEIIGNMGCTGYCSGTHLDFRIKRGDTLFNPVYMMRPYPAPAQRIVEQVKTTKTASIGG